MAETGRQPRFLSSGLRALENSRKIEGVSSMTMTVTPVDATLGAVVTGVDLANIRDEAWAEIYAAFLAYGVLVFPGQKLDEQSQGAFALRFGDVEQLSPKQQGATIEFTNRKPDGSLAAPQEQAYKLM